MLYTLFGYGPVNSGNDFRALVGTLGEMDLTQANYNRYVNVPDWVPNTSGIDFLTVVKPSSPGEMRVKITHADPGFGTSGGLWRSLDSNVIYTNDFPVAATSTVIAFGKDLTQAPAGADAFIASQLPGVFVLSVTRVTGAASTGGVAIS